MYTGAKRLGFVLLGSKPQHYCELIIQVLADNSCYRLLYVYALKKNSCLLNIYFQRRPKNYTFFLLPVESRVLLKAKPNRP